MIRLPDLDDQNYIDIVEAAKRRIPVIFPEWTDFNEHDPGITVLEVFAWLKEMQQYYLNRITDGARADMLRLLGVELERLTPSETVVSFAGEVPDFIPAGTALRTAEGAEFITAKDFVKPDFGIKSIFLNNGDAVIDITGLLAEKNTSLFPFGKEHLDRGLTNKGHELYICLTDKVGQAALLFDITDELRIVRNLPEKDSVPPRDIVWEYSTPSGFEPCSSVDDGTFALSFSGSVTLEIGSEFSESNCGGTLPNGYWIRARLCYSGCEDMPRLSRVYCAGLKLIQKKRLCFYKDLAVQNTENLIEVYGAKEGNTLVFVRDEFGWDHCANEVIVNDLVDISSAEEVICLDGRENVRVIIYDEGYGSRSMFFSSDGLPNQRFLFDPEEGVIASELRIMVKDRESGHAPRWREYFYTDNLNTAGPYDRCFSYDKERRELMFGDNEHGEVPPRSDEGIMVYCCSVTRGAAGNIMAGNITGLEFDNKEYALIQTADCSGGRDNESVYHAMSRISGILSECSRAVTAADYRAAALSTPGLRIADAAAIPFFDPASCEISELKAPNSVTVVVVPFSSERFPKPDERFLKAVREHLEKFRLVTVEVRVEAPIYIDLDISAELICATREVDKAKARVRAELEEMFSVYGGFGEPVVNDVIISRICSVEGILSVKNLSVRTDSTLCRRESSGRLIIPPNAAATINSVQLTVDS